MADWDPLASVCPLTKDKINIDKININKQECVASILLYSVDKFLFPLLVCLCV